MAAEGEDGGVRRAVGVVMDRTDLLIGVNWEIYPGPAPN